MTGAGVCLFGGCAAVPMQVTSYSPPLPPQGIVLVAEGSSGYPEVSRAVVSAVKESGLPLYVRTFDWNHGQGRVVADMMDVENARAQGRRLASDISWYRKTYPTMGIYVLAYSAGACVALEAARAIEPDSLERIILFAPAVAVDHDLRPALRAARQGVDVFTSRRDVLYLGLGTAIVGTADGRWGVPSAGRVGFDAPPTNADAALAQRLRQHPWDRSVAWSDDRGTHSGSLRPAYFRAYVLPLLTTSSARPPE